MCGNCKTSSNGPVIRSRNGELDFGLRPAGALDRPIRPAESSLSPARVTGSGSGSPSYRDFKQQERAYIAEALARTRGKIYGPDGSRRAAGTETHGTLSSKIHRMGLKKGMG
jgi:hypothetical protein